MLRLTVLAFATYTAWGVASSLIPVIRYGASTWRLPPWIRALAIAGTAYGLSFAPARVTGALACAAAVLFLIIIAVKLGAALPQPYNINVPKWGSRPASGPGRQGYSPDGTPGRRVPRLDEN